MKATFFERLGSYAIDILLLSVIASLICSGITTNSSEASKKLDDITNKWNSGEITNEVYLEEYGNLMYDYQKGNVIPLAVNATLTIAYFVIFQYMNKGQTLGKKLFHIKVVDNKTEKPISILKGLLRSLITLGIISSCLNILFIYVLNKNTYFIPYITMGVIELLFDLVTIIFILYKQDGRGLHDLMANSKVIKEGRG